MTDATLAALAREMPPLPPHDERCPLELVEWALRARDALAGVSPAPAAAGGEAQPQPEAWVYHYLGSDPYVVGLVRDGYVVARHVRELFGKIDMHPETWKRAYPLYAAPPTTTAPGEDEIQHALDWLSSGSHASYNCYTTLHDLIERLSAALKEAQAENGLLTHKLITCGVAADHPDPQLSLRAKDYGGKWDSPQAQAVRKLRADRDAALARAASCEQDAARHRYWREHIDWLLEDGDGVQGCAFSSQIPLEVMQSADDATLLDMIADRGIQRDAALASAGQGKGQS